MFAADGVNFVLLNTIDADDNGSGNHVVSGPFSANGAIRFEASGIDNTNENVEIDNLADRVLCRRNAERRSRQRHLRLRLGDGNDVINELALGGTADRISIQAPNAVDAAGQPIIDPVTLLPVPTITALNAFDSNTGTNNGDLVINYSLPTGATASVAQTITVAGPLHRYQSGQSDRCRAHQLQRCHLRRLSARRGRLLHQPLRSEQQPRRQRLDRRRANAHRTSLPAKTAPMTSSPAAVSTT